MNKDLKTFNITKINKNIKYLNRRTNNDYGNAVRLGIKSTGKFILFMDADFSHLQLFKVIQP